ncbi:hypothetical protein P175DRAFT_0497648 [Aspergillus ochraceoroseus IBT 24754]|uniref:Uncharacterized protein n=1 Tax=Aspergillus ochraceoroseus IBT 24754 TaxID=1392256 RepID=A0A2T5M7K9_9EURO|nr:uncharacterized protein P175DRAFT_0497648 [Aspergillus ochraceoroseus IBT 24754]PTU24514.1 hypothetical protein P175DRAFT_0497648 [Aspergillus ochraceoroseus IBT 24754]
MVLARAAIVRASVRGINAIGRNPTQQIGRRTYAAAYKTRKTSDMPWMLISVAVAGPGVWYLYEPRPAKTGHHESHGDEKT